jgi:catechol 1,2-dioxygenase
VLKALGRHLFRPAHLHIKVSHPEYHSLTSQVYFDGGDYLNSDVANAVREGHVVKLVQREGASELAARGLKRPYFEVHCNFVLVPRTQDSFDGNLETEMQISASQLENLT